MRLALLAVGGRIVTGCSARPAVACLAPCGKTVFSTRRAAARRGPGLGPAARRRPAAARRPRVAAVRKGECEER